MLFWHTRSFEDYIKEDIIPLGLRVQIFPTLEGLDSEFKTKWEEVLKVCPQDLMKILIDEYKKRSSTLDIDIVNICGRLQQLKTQKPIANKEQKLKTHLEAFNRDILIKKDLSSLEIEIRSKTVVLISEPKIIICTIKATLIKATQNMDNPPLHKKHPTNQIFTHNFLTDQKSLTALSANINGDPSEGQKAKKLTLDPPSHDSLSTQQTALSDTPAVHHTGLPTKNTTGRESISQTNTAVTEPFDTLSSDPSFLEKILAAVQPSPHKPNTYTQVIF